MVCSLAKGLVTSDIARIPATNPQLILQTFPDATDSRLGLEVWLAPAADPKQGPVLVARPGMAQKA
jgi:hypothetical protein